MLIALGLLQARNRSVNRVLAYRLPAGMIALSLVGIHSSVGLRVLPMAMWATGLLAVTVVGFKYFRDDRVRYADSTRSFHVPGSWLTLRVIMAIFLSKYVVAVVQALNAGVVTAHGFVAAPSLAYGCFSGYFAARAANLISKRRQSPIICGA